MYVCSVETPIGHHNLNLTFIYILTILIASGKCQVLRFSYGLNGFTSFSRKHDYKDVTGYDYFNIDFYSIPLMKLFIRNCLQYTYSPFT